ncbi:hypothetical protein [Arcobacter sp.]|uniref:hypothetical protein n=1 Tax=Arcobacter sp. TaxID=1872629 RepID=UPI003D0DA818
MNQHLNIMICYARSGGTILNKCLASLKNTIVISEVNPMGGGWGELKEKSYTTIKSQALNWFNINIKSNGFKNELIELIKSCDNKHIIIRDWSFVNFSSCKENQYNPPSKLLILEESVDIPNKKIFAFVRDSIDVWISRGMPDTNTFFSEYKNYIDSLIKHNIKIFKYEDFCINPDLFIQNLCGFLEINYSNKWKNFHNYEKVNGDVQLKDSRAKSSTEISLKKRKIIPIEKIKEVENCKNMCHCNNLLSYSIKYFN